MAAQRRRRRRKRRHSRLGPLFKVLCGIAVVVAITMGATVFFQVEEIAVAGNSRYTQEEIIQATGIQIGDNLFRMNKYEIYQQVYEQLPYIETILIRRGLPSTILVTVTEWDAVAQVLPSGVFSGSVVPSVPEGSQENVEEDDTEAEEPEALPQYATDPWLISEGGRLLEALPAVTDCMTISGLTLLEPQAGSSMTVPEEEKLKQAALLALLSELEIQEMRGDVSQIQIGSTQIMMRYLDRYDVILPMNASFGYKLRALKTAAQEREQTLGSGITGTFDLTQNYTVVYSTVSSGKKVSER